MMDRRKILRLWQRGNCSALVTLIRVEGSSYRRTGARLLIAAHGEYAGSISGGCLEAEVIRKAQWMVRDGRAVVERYSTMFDDTAEIPYGLGCGGTVDLLVEPTSTPECIALMAALEASLHGEQARVVTWLPEQGRPLRREIVAGTATGFQSAKSADLEAEVFAEMIEPAQRLFVFGAGDDAQPMVRLAALLGWSVTVIDGRTQWARPERFPEAERVIASSTLDGVEIQSCDAVVLMTHSYEQDRAWLAAMLVRAPGYLGLLGSRHRSALLVSEAAEILGWPLERACDGLFAPVGLDLGGDGAEAIALATIGEIQAMCAGKLSVSRRMTPQVVAAQIAAGGASRYLQTQCAL